jgi:hypothetical protein
VNGNGDDWSIALAVLAVGMGAAGIITDTAVLTIAAWILLIGAIIAIAGDSVTPELTLASCAVGVVFVGLAGTVAGFAVGSDVIAYGGLSICVIGFVVAVAEMWGSA